MTKKVVFLLFVFRLALWPDLGAQNTRFVHVFLGTDGTGHTFPGPSMPFGMVQPSPDTRDEGWSHTSGYQFRDTTVLGFSQSHLSGTGIGEMGDVLLLPFAETPDAGLKNRIDKNTETARPGYYTVTKKDGVRVELTASERVAMHRYTFSGKKALVLADFQHGIRFLTDSLVLESDVKLEDAHTISGWCHTKNWVERRYFFVVQFDRPWVQADILPKGKKENAPRYVLQFDLPKSRILHVKTALSTVEVAGAKRNLQAEVPHWNFDKVQKNAERAWARHLDRIRIEAPEQQKTIFYTALYHLLLQPSNIADVDGRYRGPDNRIARAPNNEYYSTLSIWDIYRAAFPLLQIVAPERVDGIARTLLIHHRAAGFLPIWTAWGQDNYCMIGNHAIPMLASAARNGFAGFDHHEALRVMVETSTRSHINSDWELYNQYGYYPFDRLDNEAVSRTLESGYDDWCVADMAALSGDTATERVFRRRAGFYKNLFDPETRLFRGKNTAGQFRSPFDPLAATSPMNNPGDYTEANAWQYFWTPAQHDLPGVADLLGGKPGLTRHLDTFFSREAKSADKFLGQEAMIGQYAHGNEPSHHVAWLYAFSDTPQTGHRLLRRIVREFHNDSPDGMIGNDDCGQMSAWYIFACLGFYPVNPASGNFVLAAPQVEKASIRLSNGKQFEVTAKHFSDQNILSRQVWLNGVLWTKPQIGFREIMAGGKLMYEMGEEFPKPR